MKNLLLTFLVFVIVLLAGCTNTRNNGDNTQVSSSEALKIVGYSVEPIDGVYEGESVYIEAQITNAGDNVVENIVPKVIGLPTSFSLQEQPDSIPELEPSNFTETLTWVYIPTAMYSTITYPFEIGIDYDYRSHSEAIIRVASREWIRSLPKEQQDIEKNKLGEPEEVPESGPIQTQFKLSSRTPYAENGQVTVYLEITNVGGGRPVNDDVTLTVSSGDLVCDNAGSVKMVNGQKGYMKCTAYIGDVTEWKNIEASIELFYKYSIRKTDLTVKVFGQSEQI
ncbi:hypothetical protein A3K63_00855 [Candidatus Micrarchaeota archaeon RBG_16_49_10]|nr:MAG: hypothetical protein A3K63_00855 [Candidatus Micrarchaeota archaeon RBG_16_49_10]